MTTSTTSHPDDARGATPPRWLRGTVAAAFGAVGVIRGGRAIHTNGVVRAGTAEMVGSGQRLSDGPAAEVLVRFSRAVGLPARLPDINGMAIRFMAADGARDLLLARGGPGPLRRLLVPGIDLAATYSTIASFDLGDGPVVVTAELVGGRTTLDQLAGDDEREVRLVAHGDGRDQQLGRIRLGAHLPDADVRFDPLATGPDVRPVGVVNALRPPAYRASQR